MEVLSSKRREKDNTRTREREKDVGVEIKELIIGVLLSPVSLPVKASADDNDDENHH